MNIRYPIYEGVYRILTFQPVEIPPMGRIYAVLFPRKIRGSTEPGLETDLNIIHLRYG